MPPPLPRYILHICRVNSIFPSAVIFRQNAYLFFKTENEQTGRLIFFFNFWLLWPKREKRKMERTGQYIQLNLMPSTTTPHVLIRHKWYSLFTKNLCTDLSCCCIFLYLLLSFRVVNRRDYDNQFSEGRLFTMHVNHFCF